MTRAKEKEARKAKAIALAKTTLAAQALRIDDEQKFHELFPECDVSLKFVWKLVQDGKEGECDLFSMACSGIQIRKKDDLAALIAKKMISDGVDLRAHRSDEQFGFTTLMMAAVSCGQGVLEIVLPHSDATAVSTDGRTAAELARELGRDENAKYIEASILSQNDAQILSDLIPVPAPAGATENAPVVTSTGKRV